ncbi:2-keto-3-deoxy-galactonokinase [Thalassovita gelatinovora]|uniref:2-keto-3-deoxy-galactonokinase n=1 Tax=Thalassovita gelatinovora TaxID=53501 RepID=A0A0P1FM22_THAGE|nr:2-dehydro-3-deoxygalactonokinase [Thalassovita gelatinovora]QIZ80850.1 2-dehydro-3-deoxygalactonokinase [Thalassovita gelatinovora]CUH63288.1 2-keto-3-deoxy-galactonokinase [Thalassovita gelatinovora]SEQ64641.1 2-keto-3-deoxy-galactonokinase [Thalassovita gelatinovora]
MARRKGIGTETVPARLLPENDDLKDLEQTAPLGLLPAPERLLLIGLTRVQQNWDGVACVIGAERSHWVQISADEAVSFQSFLTPRLAAVLAPDAARADAEAAGDSLSQPERLATQLSSADLSGDGPAILGHLIGAELAAARPYWLGQRVALIGVARWVEAYRAALAAQGVTVEGFEAGELADTGRTALRQRDGKDSA